MNPIRKLTLLICTAAAVAVSAMPAEALLTSSLEQRTKLQAAACYRRNLTSGAVSYVTEPSTEAPYLSGMLSDDVLGDACATVNLYRYIAGLPLVSVNMDYTKKAQAAALVSAVNGALSHTPSKPEEMSVQLYTSAYQGAENSNLTSGYPLLNDALHAMFRGEQDSWETLGNRRWMLSPNMTAAGFGFVEAEQTYASMYVTDHWNVSDSETYYDAVYWPAGITPTELYSGEPFCICLADGYEVLNPEEISISLSSTFWNQTWLINQEMAESKGDRYFAVDNKNYGTTRCIIFQPPVEQFEAGDSLRIHVSGLKRNGASVVLSYTVEFFSVEKALSGGLLGDATQDEAIDSDDAVLLLKEYANQMLGGESLFSDDLQIRCDVNASGVLDSDDAVGILCYYTEELLEGTAQWPVLTPMMN